MKTLNDIRATHQLSEPKTVTTKQVLNYTKDPETAVTIPVGYNLQVHFSKTKPSRLYFEYAGALRSLTVVNAHKYITGIAKPPSVATLQKWEWDSGICKTPTGRKTEPDGYGDDDSPSWMLVMGVI